MDNKIKEEIKSENKINLDFNLSKSGELILPSNFDKKTQLENNKMNSVNSISDKDLKKKIKKQIENDSKFSSDNNKSIIKKTINPKEVTINKKEFDKIIVDNIENIYQNITNLPNKLLRQKIILLIISFYVSSIHWTFLFLTKRKMERDYCFTKLNQFEACIPEQYCSINEFSHINIHLYNDTFVIHNNSLSLHQAFLKEMNEINVYYKEFFINYNYLISKNKVSQSKDISKIDKDHFNYVIILSKKEKWNFFLKYYSYCDKDIYYFYILGMILLGGCIGSITFGVLADIYGRKKIILVTLFIVTLSLVSINIICFLIEKKYNYYLDKFRNNYISSKSNKNYEILLKLFSQQKVNLSFRSYSVLLLISIFLLNLALRPLSKISCSLLLENSLSDLKVLENFRYFNFISTAVPPFIVQIILTILNDFLNLFLFFSISFLFLFISSFFILNESLRYLYEYCEWKELTNEITTVFKINEITSINYKNKIEFKVFQLEENKKILNSIVSANNNKTNFKITYYRIMKKRIKSINRDIKRRCEFIIKKSEMKINPFIIITCLKSNTSFMKSRYLFLIMLFMIYTQEYFVEKEILEEPFFGISDLYFDRHNNIIINSNFFILVIVIYLSNITFYFFYRISCFNLILFTSLIIITFLFFLYHFIAYQNEDLPVNLSQFNFKTFDIPHIRENNNKAHILLFIIQFFLNGIKFYINILFLKISNTLYRCTFLGINSLLYIISISFGDIIIFQIKHFFILIGSINFFGIIVAIFLGEFRNITFIINDLKNIKKGIKIE